MNILNFLFKNKSASKKSSIPKKLQDAYFEFDEKYCDKIQNMMDKVDDISSKSDNPDDIVSSYKKQIEGYENIKKFCEEKGGQAGLLFFQKECSYWLTNTQKELDDYLSSCYDEEKAQYLERLEHEANIKRIANHILKSLKNSDNSMLQKDLKRTLSEDDSSYFTPAINQLLKSGKVEKSKDGGSVRYTLH